MLLPRELPQSSTTLIFHPCLHWMIESDKSYKSFKVNQPKTLTVQCHVSIKRRGQKEPMMLALLTWRTHRPFFCAQSKYESNTLHNNRSCKLLWNQKKDPNSGDPQKNWTVTRHGLQQQQDVTTPRTLFGSKWEKWLDSIHSLFKLPKFI